MTSCGVKPTGLWSFRDDPDTYICGVKGPQDSEDQAEAGPPACGHLGHSLKRWSSRWSHLQQAAQPSPHPGLTLHRSSQAGPAGRSGCQSPDLQETWSGSRPLTFLSSLLPTDCTGVIHQPHTHSRRESSMNSKTSQHRPGFSFRNEKAYGDSDSVQTLRREQALWAQTRVTPTGAWHLSGAPVHSQVCIRLRTCGTLC